MAAPKRKTPKPTANDRIGHLETGMSNMSAGITAILDRMDAQDQKEPDKEAEQEQVPAKVVDLPSPTISIGEIKLRRDLHDYMERVVAYQDSTSRPGWTMEDEINMLIKFSKRNAETTMAAEQSRKETISGDSK